LAQCVVELQTKGEQKANYASRLSDALDVLGRRRQRSLGVSAGSAEMDADSVEEPGESPVPENRHSIGML
jgi:hypothetical protein